MISSARTRSDCGIVSPSDLAVFRLITSSNLVGCSTGRSAGLAPLRILSTNVAACRKRSGKLGPYAMSPPASTCSLSVYIAGRRYLAARATMAWRWRTVKASVGKMSAPTPSRTVRAKAGSSSPGSAKTLSENNCTNLGRGSVRWMRECQALPGEVQGVGVDIDGARAADLGGYGSQGGGARGHHRRHACDGDRVFHDSTRPPGAEQEVATCPGPHPTSRWRAQEGAGERSDPPGRSGGAGGADRVGRPDVAPALDLEERPAPGGEPPAHGPSGQPTTGGRTAGGGGLQSPGQSQDARRVVPSRPRRAVPVYQPAGPAGPSDHPARHLRRHEEEGTGRRLQECGTPVAAEKAARARPSA